MWPRRTRPRVLPRDVRNFVQGGALTRSLQSQVEERYGHAKARKALPAEAHVLGGAYTKQADVLIASWAAGVELLISTKTMLSSYQKNLRNRFEEGYGDAKNLRGRHPLAALGFLYILGADVPEASFNFAVDMLRKLTREPDVYDCACLLMIDGAQGLEEEDVEARGPGEDPALVPTRELGDEDEGPEVEVPQGNTRSGRIELLQGRVPLDLTAGVFLSQLIATALERTPVAMYPRVRDRSTRPDDDPGLTTR